MSKFDFNNPIDFAKATLQPLTGLGGDLAELLEGRDPGQWDVAEAQYKGVKFHVFASRSDYQAGLSRVVDQGGRRKVVYQYPYRDGQTTDDLGRKGNTYQVEAIIFGDRYKSGLRRLIQVIQQPTPGDLIHPVVGTVRVVCTEFRLTHTNEARKSVELSITFAEHNFSVAEFFTKTDNSLFGALNKALEGIALLETAVASVAAAVNTVQSVKNRAILRLTSAKTSYANLLTALNITFGGANSASIPALLPVQQGGNRDVDGTLASDIFRTAADVLSETTAQALATEQLIKDTQSVRDQIAQSIEDLKAIDSLGLYQNIFDLRRAAVLAQTSLEAALASSQPRVIQYTTPRLMSLREVAFANGVPLTRLQDLDVLNGSLESTNFIPKGTVLKVSLT